MMIKNGLFRIKVEFEDIPITDTKVNGVKGFDEVVKNIKKKFKGCK
jgi:hypothetical protein